MHTIIVRVIVIVMVIVIIIIILIVIAIVIIIIIVIVIVIGIVVVIASTHCCLRCSISFWLFVGHRGTADFGHHMMGVIQGYNTHPTLHSLPTTDKSQDLLMYQHTSHNLNSKYPP